MKVILRNTYPVLLVLLGSIALSAPRADFLASYKGTPPNWSTQDQNPDVWVC